MKTKFLFSALGLTAAFAACTNEDIVEANVNNAALEGRKVVDMELVTDLGSRATTAGWEATDKIGSILVDPATMWDVEADKHHGNNRWDFNGTTFTTQGTTVEGAWMFYYPYDAQMSKERGALKAYKSIVNQEYDATGDKMYANDFAVSPIYYVNAAEGGAKVDVVLNSVYAYGNIVAALPQSASKAKVSKVLLRFSNAYNDSLAINAETVASLAAMNYAYTTSAVSQSNPDGKTPQALAGTVKQWWNCDSTQTSLAKTADAKNGLRNFVNGNKGYATEHVTDIATLAPNTRAANYILIDCADATALADTMFTTRVLLPAREDNGQIELFIYTDKGVFGDTINVAGADLHFKRGMKADLHNVNRIADTEAAKQPTYLKMAIANGATTPIVETADLVNLIKQFNPQTASVMDVTDQLMGNVVINDAVAEALAANNKVSALKVFSVNVECTKAQTIEKLIATGNVTVKAGSNITIGGAWSVAGKTTIETSASVTVAKNCGTGTSLTYVKGALTVNNKVNYESGIESEGTITLGNVACDSASHKITAYLIDIKSGNLTVNAPVYNATGQDYKLGSSAANAAALNVTVNQNMTGKVANVLKNTTVVNNATLEVNTNAGVITNNKNLTVAQNDSTLTHKGILMTVTTNKGAIANESSATATATKGSKLVLATNNGEVTTVAYSQTDVTTNNGKIYFADNAFININSVGSHLENGNVIYVIDEDMTAETLAAKIKNTKVTAITVEDAKLTFEKDFDMSTLAKLRNAVLNGSAEVVANDIVTLHMPIWVYGTNNKISGTCPVAFVGIEAEDGVDIIDLKEGAELVVETVIVGLDYINLGKNATVMAYTNVLGLATEPHMDPTATWIGTEYETRTADEFATMFGM